MFPICSALYHLFLYDLTFNCILLHIFSILLRTSFEIRSGSLHFICIFTPLVFLSSLNSFWILYVHINFLSLRQFHQARQFTSCFSVRSGSHFLLTPRMAHFHTSPSTNCFQDVNYRYTASYCSSPSFLLFRKRDFLHFLPFETASYFFLFP